MSTLHFLNVGQGDCSIIEHNSGHVTVIDICNAQEIDSAADQIATLTASLEEGPGNFNQKKYPVNPISYMDEHDITSVFRFIATHPDMDHLDGIKYFFEEFAPGNFWDTNNNVEKTFEEGSPFNEEDWLFYESLRDGTSEVKTKRLALHSGAKAQFFNKDKDGNKGGDGLHVLSPTPELVSAANECGEHNDCSYVILLKTNGYKVLFGGDSHDKTWEHILKHHKSDVQNIDLLIAPHHGRDSDRSYDFLDVLKPRMTFFGIAKAKHLGYSGWSSRELRVITNNQAGSLIVDLNDEKAMHLYVTHEPFAKARNPKTYYSDQHKAFYLESITRRSKAASAK
jgi:competence protein ComEC